MGPRKPDGTRHHLHRPWRTGLLLRTARRRLNGRSALSLQTNRNSREIGAIFTKHFVCLGIHSFASSWFIPLAKLGSPRSSFAASYGRIIPLSSAGKPPNRDVAK